MRLFRIEGGADKLTYSEIGYSPDQTVPLKPAWQGARLQAQTCSSPKRLGPLAPLKQPIKINPAPKTNVEICSASSTRESIETNRITFATTNHHAEKLRSCNLFDTIANSDASQRSIQRPTKEDTTSLE